MQAISEIMRYCYRREILSDLRPSLVVLMRWTTCELPRRWVIPGIGVVVALRPRVTVITAVSGSVGNSAILRTAIVPFTSNLDMSPLLADPQGDRHIWN
jgi:hypothetical protein